MATPRKKASTAENQVRTLRAPATTPEGRENQLVSAAIDLAEKQIREGTASSQVITHYLKLGTTTHQLEKEKLRNENALLEAKREAYASSARIEELYETAITAMRSYAGHETEAEEID